VEEVVVSVLLVALGAMIGAPARYLIDLAVQSVHDSGLPWGTFTVNAVGSLILGGTACGVLQAGWAPWIMTLVGTGLCGALTTFSTFGYETVRLLNEGLVLGALTNVLLNLVCGLGACLLGWQLVSWLV
jgi:CrcB protein